MELDDQLAALAAGELDDDTARALRTRAAADPALARRLARHERLHDLLTSWDAPPMSDEAVAKFDAGIAAALDDLDDGPLADAAAAAGPLAAAPDTVPDDGPATAGDVVDLGAARGRRERRRGLPSGAADTAALPPWLSGAAVAAALLAVVGTGVVLSGGFGADDSDDVVADSVTEESAESDMADSAASGEAFEEDSMDEESAALAPAIPADLEIAEGDLLVLLDDAASEMAAQDDTDDTATDGDAAGPEADEEGRVAPDACVGEALGRDTAEVDGREVTMLAAGTYAGEPAQFVVVRSPDDGGDRYDVLAYDPTDCTLLERATEVR